MIFPAIDLLHGQSVRLYQGDYQKETTINPDPLNQAQQIEKIGLKHLHLVDLDGAKAGEPINLSVIQSLREKTELFIELGGGIRTIEQVDQYIKMGINRVIIGSAALTHPELVQTAVKNYGSDKIVVGVDGRNEKVATQGWLENSDTNFDDVIEAMLSVGVINFVVTDIARDGTLSGPNVELLSRLQKNFKKVIL
ncbi:1-(5-phosphoribosyl)-5-[(5-phosphoribosylamino) methylideneamino] imidazole-4-carboxamide isomerase [Leuconostoc litchii]|nr:1-(5-phosphoribosyl)-5-[(5-phosphoribosylamino) methylideneamino] imidazole-4-carboxamide isomerase [Leuconostoc litchii]